MGEPIRFTSTPGMTTTTTTMTGAPTVHEHTQIIEEKTFVQPVMSGATTTTSTTAVPTMGGVATPCHPITGAMNTMGAVPMGNTTTAFPNTTTFEQTSGVPSTTHMYGVPVATYEKHLPGKTGAATPIATAATGPLNTGPVSSTYVESHTVPISSVGAMPLTGQSTSNTFVSDSYAPVNPASFGTTSTAPLGTGMGANAPLGAAGIHHHDRAHHHHVHDRLAPGMTSATGVTPGMTGTGMTPGMTGMAPTTTTTGTAAHKPSHLNENQIIQDVIPPGRDRVVEHHEKY